MTTSVIATGGWVARRLLLIATLSLIGLFVGASAVILPQGIPLGVVGLAVLVLLWVMPDLRAVPERLAKLMFFPFIFSAICIPSYWALIFPGLPWISLRRSILFVFIGAVAITLAGSSLRRRQVIEVMKDTPLLMFCTVGYYAVLIGSTLQSDHPASSITEMINSSMSSWIPFLATIMFIRNAREVKNLFGMLVFCTIVDTIIGAIESYLKRPFLVYILPPSMREQLVLQNAFYQALLENHGLRNGMYRAVSTYNTSLSWGELAGMMAPVGAYFLAHGASGKDRVLGIGAILSCFLTVVLSGSRGGYVGFGVSMICYFLLWAIRRNRSHPGELAGGMTLVIYSMFSAAVVGAVLFVGRVRVIVLGGSEAQASNDGRKLEWIAATPKIYARPLIGHGPGTAGDVVGFYNQAGQATLDSYFINVLVDTGIIGFILFSGMIVISIISGLLFYYKRSSPISMTGCSIACGLTAYALYRAVLSQNENNTSMFILIAVTFVVSHLLKREAT